MSALPCTEVSALFVSCSPHAGFLFLHFALLQNELCKVAPWEGIGMAHLIKELLEINAGLLGVPVGVQRRMHVHVPLLVCGRCEYSYSTVCVCVYPCLFGSVYASFIPSLLSALRLCMCACVILLPVCLAACAPFNWRSSLADPASHTPRQPG